MATDTGQIIISQAQLSDVPAILEIEVNSFQLDSFTEKQFSYLIGKAKGLFYIARIGDKPVGYLSMLKHSRHKALRFYSLAVHPCARGKGVAQALYDKAFDYCREHNIRVVALEVNVNNAIAINMYKKNGFVITGTIPHYYADGADAYKMCKDDL